MKTDDYAEGHARPKKMFTVYKKRLHQWLSLRESLGTQWTDSDLMAMKTNDYTEVRARRDQALAHIGQT